MTVKGPSIMSKFQSQTPTITSPRELVKERANERRRATWRRKAKQVKSSGLAATVSQATRDRLIAEAMQSPAYEGIPLDGVSAFVNEKLDAFLRRYPWWYGRLPKDRPRQAMDVQLKSLDKARQRKAAIRLEAESPYVPEACYGTVA